MDGAERGWWPRQRNHDLAEKEQKEGGYPEVEILVDQAILSWRKVLDTDMYLCACACACDTQSSTFFILCAGVGDQRRRPIERNAQDSKNGLPGCAPGN